MFWKRKPAPATIAPMSDAEHMHAMAEAALTSSQIDFATAAKDERAVISVFFFGMASAHGMTGKLPQAQTVALARAAYQSAFGMNLASADKAVQEGIKATKPGPHQKMTPVLHAGIDAQAHYVAGQGPALAALLMAQLERVRAARS